MKHILLLLAAALLLTACSDNGQVEDTAGEAVAADSEAAETENTEAEPSKETETDASKEETNNQETDGFIESPQAPDDSSLVNIGESYTDRDGTIELIAYSPEDHTVQVGPMEVTIKGAKFMNYQPSPDMIDYFHGYTQKETKFNYLKLRVIVTNTSDETVNFAPVSYLETNTGDQKSFEDDFYLENLHGNFAPGETRKGQLGYILNETAPEELAEVKIQTSDVFQDKESIEQSKSITISF